MLLLLLSNNSNSYLGDGNVTAPVHTLELFITDKKAFISSASVIDCCPLIFIVFVMQNYNIIINYAKQLTIIKTISLIFFKI